MNTRNLLENLKKQFGKVKNTTVALSIGLAVLDTITKNYWMYNSNTALACEDESNGLDKALVISAEILYNSFKYFVAGCIKDNLHHEVAEHKSTNSNNIILSKKGRILCTLGALANPFLENEFALCQPLMGTDNMVFNGLYLAGLSLSNGALGFFAGSALDASTALANPQREQNESDISYTPINLQSEQGEGGVSYTSLR